MFRERDIEVDSDGDLLVDSNGDLKLADERQTLKQDIEFRLKTEHKDYSPSPYIGADLRAFIGEPNNRRTGELISEHIHISLSRDSRIPSSMLFIDTVPIAIHAVRAFVAVNGKVANSTEPLVVSTTLDLEVDNGLDQESILNTQVLS